MFDTVGMSQYILGSFAKKIEKRERKRMQPINTWLVISKYLKHYHSNHILLEEDVTIRRNHCTIYNKCVILWKTQIWSNMETTLSILLSLLLYYYFDKASWSRQHMEGGRKSLLGSVVLEWFYSHQDRKHGSRQPKLSKAVAESLNLDPQAESR